MNIPYLRTVVALVLASTFAGALWFGHANGAASVQAKWDAANLKAETETRVREQALQTDADTLRRTKDARIHKITGDLRAALAANRMLRAARPPEYTPAPAGTGPLCGGAGLYREDADFLVGEAARADGLRAAYLQCEAQYDAATKAVNTK